MGVGVSNANLELKFDDWWKENFLDLFTIKNIGDIPRYPLSTTKPKIDAMRYSLKIYEARHIGSSWDIAIHFKKNEKRTYFLDFFGKIDEDLDLDTRLERTAKDTKVKYSSWEFQDNKIIEANKDDKNIMDQTIRHI